MFNVDEKKFTGEKIDEIAHYAGELGAHYTGRYYETKDKVDSLEKKLSTRTELHTTDENISHYYTSKLAYLKNKLAKREKMKNVFSALPYIFNHALTVTLKNPGLLGSCTTGDREPPEILYYVVYESEHMNPSTKLHLLETQHPLLRQLNLAEIKFSKKDSKIWNTIMQTCQEYKYDKEEGIDILDPHKEELYDKIHYAAKLIKKCFPEKTLEALGPLKDIRSEVIENCKILAAQENPLEQTMRDILEKINALLGTFKKDVEELYNQFPEGN